MGSSASNTAGALVRGIDPDTIGQVIDLAKNIEVGKLRLPRPTPRSSTRPAPEEVIGRGPGGEPLFQGPDFRQPPDVDPSVRDFLKQQTRILPGRHHRPRAREIAPRARRGRGDAPVADGRARPHRRDAALPQVPCRGDLLQRHVRVRRHARVRVDGRGAEVLRPRRTRSPTSTSASPIPSGCRRSRPAVRAVDRRERRARRGAEGGSRRRSSASATGWR